MTSKDAVAILVNDIHLDKGNGNLVKDIFRQLIQVCRDFDVENIICGGDIFTNRSAQPMLCLTDWKDILDELSKNEIWLDVIPGNHDKTDPDDERSYLDVYNYPLVRLHREAECCIIRGAAFAFIPYFNDEKWMKEYEKADGIIEEMFQDGDIEPTAATFLITHSGFDGVRNNDGTEVKSIIKPSMFEHYSKVLIGHYHNASKLSKNVIYTGSAYQGNYGETLTDKGFTVIFDDGTIKHVPSHFPRYIKETVDVNDSESIRNLIEKYDGEEYDHVRIVFRGSRADRRKVNLVELSKSGIDCQYESIEETEAIDNSVSADVLCYDKKSIIKDFVRFCAENNIKGDKMKYGMNLIKSL